MPNDIIEAMQFGSNLVGSSLDRQMRRQEMTSRDAERQVRERLLADQAQKIEIAQQKHELASKELGAAASEAAIMAAPYLDIPPAPGEEGPSNRVENPNRTTFYEAYMQKVAPLIAKHYPEKTADIFTSAERMKSLDALAELNASKGKDLATQPSGPTFSQIPNPVTKKDDLVFMPGRGKGVNQLVTPPTIEEGINPATQQPFGYLQSAKGIPKVLPSSDIEARQNRAAVTQWALKNAPELMKVDPSDPTKITLPSENFEEAAKRAGLPVGTRAKMEQTVTEAENVFRVGQQLLPLLTPENTGIRGAVARKLVEGGLAEVFPGMKIGSATETLAIASRFRAGLTRALRSDSNIAEAERESIIEGIPDPKALLGSSQQGKILLAAQLESAGVLSRATSQKLGKPITPFFMKPEEIADGLAKVKAALASGQITLDQAKAAADKAKEARDNNAWTLIQAIREQVQR